MAQSLSKIYVHLIFHIKSTCQTILPKHLDELHAVIGGLAKTNGCNPIQIGGTQNHVHILCTLSRDITVSNLVKCLKLGSHQWLKTQGFHYKNFGWQAGYAIFSVSQSALSTTTQYIKNQIEHHRHKTFEEEYMGFLRLYQVDYDEQFIFKD